VSHRSSKDAARARLVLPVAGAGLIIACAGLLLRGTPERHTVSQVARMIQETALASSEPDAPPEAGILGPWLITAERIDPVNGHLLNFRLQSGQMMIAAMSARIAIDPENDTFSFEMWNVVYTRVPEPREENQKAFTHALEHYVLGPAPYKFDIVADGAGALAGVMREESGTP
jgi:hypothetical protein